MAVFVPTTNKLTAHGYAEHFMRHVYTRFGLPVTLVTDRDKLFMSSVWQSISKLLGTRHQLSTAYHPQTDGQTESINKVVEQYIRLYGNYTQTDWADLLPYAEFCYNSTPHTTTKVAPYQALTGYMPRRTLEERPGTDSKGTHTAKEFVAQIYDIHQYLKENIECANRHYEKTYNNKRKPYSFKVDDLVLLKAKHLKQLRPSQKLSDKFLGPHKVTEVINPMAYRIDLPTSSRVHNVFHISLLKPYHGSAASVPVNTALEDEESVVVPVKVLSTRKVLLNAKDKKSKDFVPNYEQQYHVYMSDKTQLWTNDELMRQHPNWPTVRDAFEPKVRVKCTKHSPGWKGWVRLPS